MKKGLFLIPAAALALASCSNDDFSNDANNGLTGETEIHYMAVNLVDNADVPTRADYETDYEDGIDSENEVTSVRFYFFDSSDNAFTTNGKCYFDTTAEPVAGETPNIEKKLQAVIVFETEKSSTGTTSTPAKIVAVLNPPTDIIENPTNIAALQDEVKNYGTSALTTSGKFVMSNAVYATSNTVEHVAYDIQQTNIKESKAAALAAPVNIYVERVVAKVRVDLTETLKAGEKTEIGNNVYALELKDGENTIYGATGAAGTEKPIYVKLLGWNVTGTAPVSRLVKKINPAWGGASWDAAPFAWGVSNLWNKPDYFRSFWAINPDDVNDQSELVFGNFNVSGTNKANGIVNFTPGTDEVPLVNYTYLQENAAWANDGSDPTYPTKLIVAAQLVDDEGHGVDLGWYAGSYYMQNDLKTVILNNANIFKKTTDSNVDTYNPATTSDLPLQFITATEAGDFSEETGERNSGVSEKVNRYNSYGKAVATSIPADTYYVKNADGSYDAIADVTELNAKLKAVGPVKVWTSGYTYYWIDITHLGAAEQKGQKGIVRNHIYDYTLDSFHGFGIPVEKPGETIYPEEPNDPEMMYIAAKINILSWRLVSHNNTVLGWD